MDETIRMIAAEKDGIFYACEIDLMERVRCGCCGRGRLDRRDTIMFALKQSCAVCKAVVRVSHDAPPRMAKCPGGIGAF